MKRYIVALLLVSTVACSRQPQQQQWGQGYETQQGYMQPDHSYLYYWVLYHVMFSNAQPTYHVYTPPAGYAPIYRPWQAAPSTVKPQVRTPDTRSTGGFSTPPSSTPRAATPSRSTGGFSSPRSSPSPSRSSGSSSRSSGGFSRR